MAGDPGGPAREGHVECGLRSAGAVWILRPPPQTAVARHVQRGLGRRRRQARARGGRCQSHLPAPVPDARIYGHVVRRCGCATRSRHDLVVDPERLRAAQYRGRAARPRTRPGARDLHARIRLLRHQRRRYGVLRCRPAVAGCRPSGSRAAVAAGRDGVGELRLRLRHRSTRCARRRRDHRRLGLRVMVCVARRPARVRSSRQCSQRVARGLRTGAVRAAFGAGAGRSIQ